MNDKAARISMKDFLEALAAGEEAFQNLVEQMPSQEGDMLALLMAALRHEKPEVREAASVVLSEMGAAAAPVANDITQALRDPNPIVRGNAALALAGIGKPAAEALEELDTALGMEEDAWASAIFADAITRIEKACAGK